MLMTLSLSLSVCVCVCVCVCVKEDLWAFTPEAQIRKLIGPYPWFQGQKNFFENKGVRKMHFQKPKMYKSLLYTEFLKKPFFLEFFGFI